MTDKADSQGSPQTTAPLPSYSKVRLVEIETWVTHRSKFFVKHNSDPDDKEWRACIRHSNGVMEWQWCDTFDEAVKWCDSCNGCGCSWNHGNDSGKYAILSVPDAQANASERSGDGVERLAWQTPDYKLAFGISFSKELVKAGYRKEGVCKMDNGKEGIIFCHRPNGVLKQI